MTQALRDKLGKAAYTAFYGRYANWETLPEEVRDKWRDVAESTAILVAGYIVEPTKALGRGELSPAGFLGELKHIFMDDVVEQVV